MQSVIIAGGRGTRLYPLTDSIPKPMLPLMERPFLAWMVERCRAAGITDILMNVHYQADQIQDYFGDGGQFGVDIRYIQEAEPLGTAGAMKLAEPYFTGESLIVFNADILTDLDLGRLIQAHQQTNAKATLALARVDNPMAFGLVELWPTGSDQGGVHLPGNQRVRAFREKPSADEVTRLGIDTVNAGTYVLEPDLLAEYSTGAPLSFERTIFPRLLEQEQPVTGFVWPGYWLDLGTPSKYYQAHLDILTGSMPYDLSTMANEQAPHVWIAKSATVATTRLEGPCYIGERVCLGPHADIPAGTIIGSNSLINQPLHPGIYPPATLAVAGSS